MSRASGRNEEAVPAAERPVVPGLAGTREVASASAESAAPAQADDVADELVAQTMAFVTTFERWSGRKAVEAGASVQRLKLLYSIHCHGPRKMADLAGELDTTPRNVTAIVDGLEAEGLVRRVPHASDRRVTLIELTCKRDQVAEQFVNFQRSVGELFADLDETERQTLARVLSSLRAKMRVDETRRPANG